MTARAFILIETAVGKTQQVLSDLQKMPSVKSADPVTGPYDIIVVVEASDLNAIGNMVASKVHPIEGITRTVTCLTVKLS